MSDIIPILAFILIPAYFACDAKWQNIILLFLSMAFIHTFFYYESYIILASLFIVYFLSYILTKMPSTKLLIIICLVVAGILIVIREQSLIVRSVISFLLLNSVAFLNSTMKQKSLPSFIEGCLYLAYFPKIICGPYEKLENFIPLLERHRSFSFSATAKGLTLIILGIFERYSIAGNISCIREKVAATGSQVSVIDLIFSGMLYGFELFFIISAFTNFAKGSSIIFGIPLSDNFKFPFISSSLSDFWRRWHISIHIWMKEHIYLPLKEHHSPFFISILVTFIASSIWHKPTLSFLIWGILASLLIYIEKILGLLKYQKYYGIPLVFVLTSILWIFFQTDNLSFFISNNIQFQSNIREALTGLVLAIGIAFVLSIFCELQGRLIEKKPLYFVLPAFVIDLFLLLSLWPSKIAINPIYGF